MAKASKITAWTLETAQAVAQGLRDAGLPADVRASYRNDPQDTDGPQVQVLAVHIFVMDARSGNALMRVYATPSEFKSAAATVKDLARERKAGARAVIARRRAGL